MATLTNVRSVGGVIVNIYDYTISGVYSAIDLERLPDDSIHGLQEEYEQKRLEFEDYSAFETYYGSIFALGTGGTATIDTSELAKETKQDLIIAELSKNFMPYYDVVTGTGTTPSNAYAFSVTNIGDTAGTLDGSVFPVDGHVEYTNVAAPLDYDATGTTYLITAHLTND